VLLWKAAISLWTDVIFSDVAASPVIDAVGRAAKRLNQSHNASARASRP
jgi:hypothetical protein